MSSSVLATNRTNIINESEHVPGKVKSGTGLIIFGVEEKEWTALKKETKGKKRDKWEISFTTEKCWSTTELFFSLQ